MNFANEWDIDNYLRLADDATTPNLVRAAIILNNLAAWTNENSDGWAYWPKPCRAAARLIQTLRTADFVADISTADLRKACAPIKAFLTRQGVDHAEVFPNKIGV